jgi:hypothetical protein
MNRAPRMGSSVKAAGRLKKSHSGSAIKFDCFLFENLLCQLHICSVVLWIVLFIASVSARRIPCRHVSCVSGRHDRTLDRSGSSGVYLKSDRSAVVAGPREELSRRSVLPSDACPIVSDERAILSHINATHCQMHDFLQVITSASVCMLRDVHADAKVLRGLFL